jgi:hypothetical protein
LFRKQRKSRRKKLLPWLDANTGRRRRKLPPALKQFLQFLQPPEPWGKVQPLIAPAHAGHFFILLRN